MSNQNSQLDGLGSFNQLAQNAGTIKYGAFNNASKNTGVVALSATFNSTSQNLGTIGDILPIETATIVQSNSANWDTAYTAVISNSAVWILSGGGTGDATNAPTWDAVSSYVQSNSGDFILEGDSRLSDSRTPVAHDHDASAITSGKLDPARLPVIPSQEQVIISGSMYTSSSVYNGGNDHFTYSLSSINQGTIVTTTDGYRWVYVGSGDKRYDTSYVELADITPEWSVIANKPSTFPAESHTHSISSVTNLQSSLNTLQSNIDGKQASGDYVLSSDSRLARADTSFTYLTANSANISTTYSYVNTNSANIVMTSDSRLTNATNTFNTVQSNSGTWATGATGTINYTIDGGGIAITTGSKGFVQIPTNFVVQEWNIVADLQTTSFIVDVRKASYSNIPTTSSIVGVDYLTLTNQQKNRNLSVSWTNISAGDFVEFYVTDASNASMVNISLKGVRS